MQEELEIREGLLEESIVFPDCTEQFEHAEKARESEGKWLLLKNPRDVVLILDREGTILFINPTLPGFNIEDTIGKTVYDFIPTKQHKKIRKAINEVFKTGEVVSFETSVFAPDGSLLRWSTRLNPVKNRNKVISVAQISNNTKRKKAKEEAKKYKTISDRAGYGTAMSDLKGNLTYVNDSFARMHGYKKVDELIGKNLSIVHNAEQIENVNRLNTQLIRQGNYVAEEVWHTRKDGTIFCALMNGTLIRDDKGQPQFLSCTALDITERKRAEEKVLESEKKYRGLTESLSELVYRAESKTFAATYVNNTVERFYGYSAEEWLRDPSLWENLIHPDDKERVLTEITEAKRKLKSSVIKYRIINKNKTVRWVEDHVSWEKDQQGKVISMNGVMYDITEHQKTEERQTLRFEISKTFHQQKSLKNICKKIVSLIKEHLDCEVVALRMKEGDDYPYFVNNGFSQKFIKSENYLCIHDEKGDCLRDSRGYLVLACMCGIVINAKLNQDKPFCTKKGSFWTNSTSDLLASKKAKDRGATTRNVCNQDGYESVALIPIKVSGDNIGLLQINDKKRNLFSLGSIQFLEELGHIIGIAIESKKTEEALHESEQKYRILVESAGESIVTINKDGVFLFMNETGAKRLGGKPEDYVGKTIWDLFPKEIADQQAASVRGVINTEQGMNQIVLTELQGQPRWYNTTLEPLRDGSGKVTAALIIARDIHELKQSEEEIRKLTSAVEQSIDGIAIGDLEPKLIYVNDAFARMYGYTSEDMVGMPITNLYNKKQMDEYKKALNQLRIQGSWEGEIGHIRKDGTAFPTYASVTLLKNNEGKPIGTLAITRDMTASKRREEEFNIYREKMARAEQLASLGTFSASVAHELTQPLTVIRLSIENSLAELDTISYPSTIEEDLKEGLNEISNVISIVDKFHNFARSSSETTVVEVVLKATAERIMDLLDESAWRAKVLLRVEGMDKLPPIYSHEKQLEQLFYSLVENAIQAADGKKSRQVIISGVARNEHIELQFSDNCYGIAPENLDMIFEPFFTTKPASEGTGLGLCVVERIVSQLNGKIRVESKLGKGSTFFVTLPIKGDGR